MSISKTVSARNAACNGIVDLIDVNGPGSLKIYDTISGPPAVLASFTFQNPAFGSASDGTAAANPITNTAVSSDGTATQFRVYDGNTSEIFRGVVTASGGGGDMEFNSVIFNTGTPLAISNALFIVPE